MGEWGEGTGERDGGRGYPSIINKASYQDIREPFINELVK